MNKEKSGVKKILLLLLFLGTGLFVFADNPLVTDIFTADPAGFVANNRMYVICSHDQDNATSYNELLNYVLLSSSDLVNWQNHGIVFDVRKDTSWAYNAYAPDMLYHNGKYYLYFPNGATSIGVAVADSPEGPFRDPVGHAILDKNTPNCNVEWCFDPGVFLDDDGQGYLYFGGGGPGNARVIKLGSDLISVTGSAVTIDAPRFFEASYMHKRDGIYYFSYSSDFSEGAATIEYMTSDNPMTGFQHRGTILPNPWSNLGNNNHHSIVEYAGNWYIFYHNRAVSNSVYQRSACIDRLYYNSDGTIKRVNATQAGVDPVNPGTPTPTPEPTPVVTGNILIRAAGSKGGEIIRAEVNGATVGTWTLKAGFQTVVANGSGGVRVYFTNDDEVSDGLDVQIDYIEYDGQIYEAEDQEINTGTWQDDSCGGSYSEMLHCNGYIQFATGPAVTPTPGTGSKGDVNNDGSVTIVDALMVAQYYVSLTPSGFVEENADTNCDGTITIVDALIIAQYYVGLISGFCL